MITFIVNITGHLRTKQQVKLVNHRLTKQKVTTLFLFTRRKPSFMSSYISV
jgi:phosphopantetheine adenylyltransferase